MAAFDIVTIQSGRNKRTPSQDNTFDFEAIRIGASNLVIQEDGAALDLGGNDLKNLNLAAAPSNYSPAGNSVREHLAAIDTAIGVAAGVTFDDDTFEIVNSSDNSKKLDFDVSAVAISTTRTITMADADIDLSDLVNIYTLQGVAQGAVDFGTFTGTTLSDNETLKNLLQELETALELRALDADVIKKDGSVAYTGNQSMGGNKITNLGTPTADSDAATKAYVDSLSAGLDPKESVRLATTADLAATYNSTGGPAGTGQFTGAPTTIDNVAIAEGDRILVKDQNTLTENGIYVVTATTSTWNRASDMDGSPANEVSSGNFTFVESGDDNASTGFVVIGAGTLTLNSDDIVWTIFSNISVSGGDGISVGSNEIDVVVADFAGTGLEDDGSNNLRISADAAGDGLTGGAGSALAVGAGDGIEVGADSVAVDYSEAFTNDNAGAVTAGQVVYVKSDGDVDLAQANVANLADFQIGIVKDASIAAAASGAVIVRAGAKITGLSGLTPGQKVYVSRSAAGGLTQSLAGFVATEFVYQVGHAISATEMIFEPQFLYEY
jgi:hypothetical protein